MLIINNNTLIKFRFCADIIYLNAVAKIFSGRGGAKIIASVRVLPDFYNNIVS